MSAYTMPHLQVAVTTTLVNFEDIAKTLNRSPTYLAKFFEYELGAQAQMNPINRQYIVNGCHDQGKLQVSLDAFIKRFVLCQNCENPETVLKVHGKTQISLTCKECGHLGCVDMKHKLTAFIIENPPVTYGNAEPVAESKKMSDIKKEMEKSAKDQTIAEARTKEAMARFKKGTNECPVCAKTLAFPNGMLRHVATHYGDRPFACTKCPYRASQKDHMKKHKCPGTEDD